MYTSPGKLLSSLVRKFLQIVLVDLDNNSLLRSQGDEGRLIPKKLQKALTSALKEDSG